MATVGYDDHLESRFARRQTPLNVSEDIATADCRAPWTSARCHRLLRPLSSKIALLRKARQFNNQQHERDLGDHSRSFIGRAELGDQRNTEKAEQQMRSECKTATEVDREWESSPRPRKKIKRTYSSKTKSISFKEVGDKSTQIQLDHHPTSASIELPAQLAFEAIPLESLTPDLDDRQILQPTERGSYLPDDLPRSLARNDWKLVDGICKGFIALLRATAFKKPAPSAGCRSLLSTCLRQIPQYITEEEYTLKRDNPDSDADISTMVYNELEELGSMPGGGWQPLRLAVRAHGTKLITGAIEENLLDVDVARHLCSTCLEYLAYDEAQCIVGTLIIQRKPAKTKPSRYVEFWPHEVVLIVDSLHELAYSSGRNEVLYRYIAAMLESHILSTDWISNNATIVMWNAVIRSIAHGTPDLPPAVSLLQTAIAAAGKATTAMALQSAHGVRLQVYTANSRPSLRFGTRQATENITDSHSNKATNGRKESKAQEGNLSGTLFNILTVLSAIARLRAPVPSQASDESTTEILMILQDLALEANKTIELSSQSMSSQQFVESYADSICIPLLAAGLAELAFFETRNLDYQQSIPSLTILAENSKGNKVFAWAGSFICAGARYTARARSEDSFTVTKAIVQELMSVSKSTWAAGSVRKLCSDLALAAAFTYAEDTSRPAHLDWASQVESDLTGKGFTTPKPAAVRTPARTHRHSKNSYRWEEGICEWITRTPDLLLQKSSKAQSNTNYVGAHALTPCIGIKHTMPLQSGISIPEGEVLESPDQKEYNKLESLQVIIPLRTSSSGTTTSAKEISSSNSQPKKKKTGSKAVQNIHKDDDIDELSTPEPSQESSALRELPNTNAAIGAKRKRQSARQVNLRAPESSTAGFTQSHLPPEGHGKELEAADVDELAMLFKW